MPHRDPHQLEPLLHRSRTGEPEAKDALLEKLRPYLKALIRSWLGTDLARQLADSDVVQETLLRIHQGFAEFRGQTVPELIGWVRRVAYHAAIDRKRQAGLPGQAGGDRLQDVAGGEAPPEVIEKAEEVIRLAAALEQLSEPRREIIHARLFEGLSYADISRRLGRTEGALRVLFNRALGQLRQIMETES